MANKIAQLKVDAPANYANSIQNIQSPTIHVVHSIGVSNNEEPLYLCRLKSGGYAYIRESLLTQEGGTVKL